MQTDLITKVYFNEHLTHSCVGMPQGLQALLSSFICIKMTFLYDLKCVFSFHCYIIISYDTILLPDMFTTL